MHVAAFIGKLQNFGNLKLSYLNTCKWAISPILSDQFTYKMSGQYTPIEQLP